MRPAVTAQGGTGRLQQAQCFSALLKSGTCKRQSLSWERFEQVPAGCGDHVALASVTCPRCIWGRTGYQDTSQLPRALLLCTAGLQWGSCMAWTGAAKGGGHLQACCWECICPPVSAQATHPSTAHAPQPRLPTPALPVQPGYKQVTCRMHGAGCRMKGAGCRVQNAG